MEQLQAGDPRRIGPYTITARLGAGGMGQVYLGRSQGGRLVAVKVVHPEWARDKEFRMRFAREVQVARTVGGFFTAPVVDADTEADQPWLATGYVDGPSLTAAVAERGPMPERSLFVLAAGLAEGLSAVHAAGVVHRDLKPSNVLLAQDGLRVIDFGIARAANSSALTGTGRVIGSPSFMSPEQAQGLEVGPASDVFAMGSVVVFAATGAPPFGVGTVPDQLFHIVYDNPRLDELPPSLRPLIERCMSKDPAGRPSAEAFLAQLPRMPYAGQSGSPHVEWWPAASSGVHEPTVAVVREPAAAVREPTVAVVRQPAAHVSPPSRHETTGWPAPPSGTRIDPRVERPASRSRATVLSLLAALVVAGGVYGGWVYAHNRLGDARAQGQYYVGVNRADGDLAVYRGNTLYALSNVPARQLPESSRLAFSRGVAASSLSSAQDMVASARGTVTACRGQWGQLVIWRRANVQYLAHPSEQAPPGPRPQAPSSESCGPASSYSIKARELPLGTPNTGTPT